MDNGHSASLTLVAAILFCCTMSPTASQPLEKNLRQKRATEGTEDFYQSDGRFSFGLGKRQNEEDEDYDLNAALLGDKLKRDPYEFGLGKRDYHKREPYAFGLGKRTPYQFGLGKREPYAFGLGKRSYYGFGLGKREPYAFGLGKR